MTRDKKQEKKIRLFALLIYKIPAVLALIAVPVLIGLAIFKPDAFGNKEGPMFLAFVAGAMLVGGLFSWVIGRGFGRFKKWAWWVSMVSYGINFITTIVQSVIYGAVIYGLLERGKESPDAIANAFLMIGSVVLSLVLLGLIMWFHLSKRTRRVFSREYQQRLADNSFDRFKVVDSKR